MAIHHQVSFISRLAADPEPRVMPSGTIVLTLRIPVNDSYEGRDGRVEETTWYEVEFFGDQASKIEKRSYLKGDTLFVQGQPSAPRIYPKRDGSTGVSIRVKFAQVVRVSPKSGGGDLAPTEEPVEAAPARNGHATTPPSDDEQVF